MIERELVVKDLVGLHAQPATIICNEARKYDSVINIKFKEKVANALSIFEIIKLNAVTNSIVILSVDGSDECMAIESLVSVLRDNDIVI